MSSPIRQLTLSCALLLLSAPVLAQDPANPTEDSADAAVEMPVIEVIGTDERKKALPGSAQVIDRETLDLSHVMTTNEALRKAAGVNVRDEEGFGLRPNIGIRGLNPTRSTKVLLLEDGIPLAYAPYGDNASYYHPPVERFDHIELLKGAAQNMYGPQTAGGVINYITPAPPADFSGRVRLTGGSREYLNAHGFVGGRNMLLDYVRKQGDGARDNVHSELNDVNYKAVLSLTDRQAVTARANYYSEDSQNTYTGLTDAEFANFGARYNPFDNDFFNADREGVSFTHELALDRASALTTNFYGARFNRHWWRQSSRTTDTQCGTGFRDARIAGAAVNPDTCNSIQGRLREYYTYGVEPRLRVAHGATGAGSELELGLRAHYETQDRIQKNGTSPTARDGTLAESNERLTDAYAGFAQNRFAFGSFAVTPGVRVEHILLERTNRLTGATGEDESTEVLPSLGMTWAIDESTLFAGVHRGFAPPRTEDVISNAGTSVDLDSELSWNVEAGARVRPAVGVLLETTAFRNEFDRQYVVGSVAGGDLPLAVGQTLYEGIELLGRLDAGRILDTTHNPFVEVAYTWLPVAEQETALRCINPTASGCMAGAITGSVAGNRLPYAPENLLTTSVGYNHPVGVDARVEMVLVDAQYSDFANSVATNGTGLTGEIDRAVLWNAALTYTLAAGGPKLFVTGKNLFDKVYVADRTRGILPGAPRLLQAGVEYSF
jgi:Fe(3+) dicitrate transport protein